MLNLTPQNQDSQITVLLKDGAKKSKLLIVGYSPISKITHNGVDYFLSEDVEVGMPIYYRTPKVKSVKTPLICLQPQNDKLNL